MTLSARITVTGLMVLAATGALARSANSSMFGRMGGALAAGALLGVAIGAWRRARWAFGAAFFVGLCWLWAVLALAVNDAIGAGETVVWIAWAVVVMVTSVRTRPADARQRLHT